MSVHYSSRGMMEKVARACLFFDQYSFDYVLQSVLFSHDCHIYFNITASVFGNLLIKIILIGQDQLFCELMTVVKIIL